MIYQATGIVLAGGKSSRMGKDKALLQLDNQTLLSRSIEKLQQLFQEVVVVTNRLGKYKIDADKEVVDIYKGRGPLGGIHAGLKAARFEWVLVTACDMPFWEPDMVEMLLKNSLGYDAVVPKRDNHLEPLFALYQKSCLQVIENCLEDGVSKIIDFYSFVRTNYLELDFIDRERYPADQVFININTPEDWDKIANDKRLESD